MGLERGMDGSEPVRPEPVTRLAGAHEERRARSAHMADGTLACPECDAPVAIARARPVTAPLTCPYCAHAGPLRDFLSLTAPTRPARVSVRVSLRPARSSSSPGARR